MIGLVIVTHGRLADEFRAALEHVMGPQKQIESISIARSNASRVFSGASRVAPLCASPATATRPPDVGYSGPDGRTRLAHLVGHLTCWQQGPD